MQREADEGKAGQQNNNPGTKPIAENPNPRANENLSGRLANSGSEGSDLEDEVGSEITDGEDA